MKKIILITGASSDIGMSYIREHGAEYTKILAHCRHTNEGFDRLKETFGDKLLPLQADFSLPAETESFAAQIAQLIKEEGMTPTHILHLASLPAASVRLHKTDTDAYRAMMQVSVYSIVEILKACLPAMQRQHYGRIVFLLSAYTTIPDPKFAAPYITSKYALLGLMKSLSAEYAPKGITANGISPQMIETKFLKDVPELIVEQQRQASPLGRLLTENDILPAIQLLLSDEAAALTGENISITGGNYIL
jgi:3-oxoacyl-[acyl-carrier protein] reductase